MRVPVWSLSSHLVTMRTGGWRKTSVCWGWQSRKVGKISLDYAGVLNKHSGRVLSLDTLRRMFKYLVCWSCLEAILCCWHRDCTWFGSAFSNPRGQVFRLCSAPIHITLQSCLAQRHAVSCWINGVLSKLFHWIFTTLGDRTTWL